MIFRTAKVKNGSILVRGVIQGMFTNFPVELRISRSVSVMIRIIVWQQLLQDYVEFAIKGINFEIEILSAS